MASVSPDSRLITLPVDLLKHITNELDSDDEKSLKLTCRRMNLLVAPPRPAQLLNLNNPVRDGRSTPLPQGPLPETATKTMQRLEQESADLEERELQRGMEVSDTEDGFDDDDNDDDHDDDNIMKSVTGAKPTKYKGRSKVMNWTTQLDSAPSSPGLRSPSSTSFRLNPKTATPPPRLGDFHSRQ